MRISRRGLDVGMVERALHELEIAGLAQDLGRKIVPIVVEAKSINARALAQSTPRDLHTRIGEGIALALRPAITGALGDIGEDGDRMMSAQRPENFPDDGRNRHCDQLGGSG